MGLLNWLGWGRKQPVAAQEASQDEPSSFISDEAFGLLMGFERRANDLLYDAAEACAVMRGSRNITADDVNLVGGRVIPLLQQFIREIKGEEIRRMAKLKVRPDETNR